MTHLRIVPANDPRPDPIEQLREHARSQPVDDHCIARAIGDWLSDPRFLSGVWIGVIITCASALLWAFA